MTTAKADLIFASLPYRILHGAAEAGRDKIAKRDAAFYARWRRRASSSISATTNRACSMKYLRRGSGYYIDVGASQLIIDGKIKLKSGQVERIEERTASARPTAANCPPT
jgi:putative flavoprotein involved in K+ transport